MADPSAEIANDQRIQALAADLKARTPYFLEDTYSLDSLDRPTSFLENPFAEMGGVYPHPLVYEYAGGLAQLQEDPIFSELQDAARKRLALGFATKADLFSAFVWTIHNSSLPRFNDLREKHEQIEYDLEQGSGVKGFFDDLKTRIFPDEEARKVFLDSLVASLPDGSVAYDEREELIAFLKKEALGKKKFTLADFGCGTGRWTRKYKEILGEASFVLGADQQYHGEVPFYEWSAAAGINFFKADFRRIPLADSSLDCAVLGYVLPHITEKLATEGLKEIERVLKEGGALVVGPMEQKETGERGYSVFRKLNGVLVESEEEFLRQ